MDTLSPRALNRATLKRQHLLERSDMPPASMIEHLVGMQAQNPLDPYLALWSRLTPFDPVAVGDLLSSRALVRMGSLRATIHL
ncbi:MAG TPA: crosslink repair DNA glycosylase YcaQ family protein, partial [Acidimicrobiia bacterium]|nr:crosslink repair DNA glycosylase YcaQ family protein [Acidimicrobiia bacterium]